MKQFLHSHYYGVFANAYEKIRESQSHWHAEHAAVVALLTRYSGMKVLDCPVGTGRFIPLYSQLGCTLVGADISTDMLNEAKKKAERLSYHDLNLIQADAAETVFGNIDIAISVRFLNLVPADTAIKIIQNLARATNKAMILHVTSIDMNAVPHLDRTAIDAQVDADYSRQKSEMAFASHRLADFIDWTTKAGFKIERSIECQERHGHSRTHMHHLVKM